MMDENSSPTMMDRNVAHYQILEKVGEGGMGVVYRARDTRLERDVALKFLSLDFTGSEELKQRFIKEAQAASALDHPNICTIHAIEETEDGRLFIAMGYYEGETVKTKLKRGPLPWQEVVDLAAQAAAGLQAAHEHERRIIHMDVKPANLMVTPDGTVKTLDFGLSRFTTEVDRTRPQGPLMGTIAYMSPERVQGEKTGPECDVWALGVVMYEMVTGTRPFHGNNDMSLLYSIVHREAPAPIEKAPEMPEELDRIIRRCLVKDWRHRIPLAEVLVGLQALQYESQGMTQPVWAERQDLLRRKARRRIVWPAAALVLVAVAVKICRQEPVNPEPVTVAMAGLESRMENGAADWIGTALVELLAIELPEGGCLRWQPQDGTEPADAEWVVDGTYQTVVEAGAEQLKLAVRLQDKRSGDGIVYPPLTGRPTELPEMAAETAGLLAADLGCAPLERTVEDAAALPVHPDAARLLHEAVDKLRQWDAPAAKELLQQATAFEPQDNALLLVYLADAEWHLGFEDEAKKASERAVQAARRRPRDTQIYVRAVRLEKLVLRARAAALLRALWVRDRVTADEAVEEPLPTRADLGLRLAELLARSFQEEAARTTLASLSELLPGDPRMPLIEGLIEYNSRSLQRAQEAYARAADLARRRDEPLLLAKALLLEAQAWQWQGKHAETEARLKESRDIYRSHGHVRGEADTLLIYGNIFLDRKDLQHAKEMFEEAARLLGTIGSSRLQARVLVNLGSNLADYGDREAAMHVFDQAQEILERVNDLVPQQIILSEKAEDLAELGRFDEAESMYQKAFEMLKSVPEPGNEGLTLSSYGWFRILRGDLGGAKRSLDAALKIQNQAGDELNSAWTIFRLAEILHYQGALKGALQGYEKALRVPRQGGGDFLVAMVWAAQGETLMSQADLAGAELKFDAALEIQDAYADRVPAAKTRLSRAALLIEQGRHAEAESAADDVLTDLAQSPVLEVSRAHVLRAQSLLAQGRTDAAEEAIGQARQVLREVASPIYRLPLELTAARIAAARGAAAAEVRQTLQSPLATAAAGGFTQWRLEIELVLGEVELRSGSLRGLNRLRDLRREAESNGYGLIARKARALHPRP